MLTFLAEGMTELVANSDLLKTIVEYGMLGIIAFAFLKQNERQQKMLTENFQTMINQMIKDDNSPELTNILQTIQSHNLNSVKMLAELSSKIQTEQKNRDLLVGMVNDYNSLVRELKVAVIRIKNNNTTANQAKLIGEILITEGYITREQLETCLRLQSDKDLDVLDDLAKPLDKRSE